MTDTSKIQISGLCIALTTMLAGCGSGSTTAIADAINPWVEVGSQNTQLNGLTFDPATNNLYSINTEGALCALNINADHSTPWNCNLNLPTAVKLEANQLVADGNGHIYAIGNYNSINQSGILLQYATTSNSWNQWPLSGLPIHNQKILYKDSNVYLNDSNNLYAINLNTGATETKANFFNPTSFNIGNTIDDQGNVYYTTSNNIVYYNNLNATPGTTASQFGGQIPNILWDLAYYNNNIYTCNLEYVYSSSVNNSNSHTWSAIHSTPTFTLPNGSTISSGCRYITGGSGYLFVYSSDISTGTNMGQIFKLKI